MIHFTDPQWKAIEHLLTEWLHTERERLEDPNKGMNETNVIRGKIAAYKRLLALPKQQEARTPQDDPA